jgi:quinate dehydrogenase
VRVSDITHCFTSALFIGGGRVTMPIKSAIIPYLDGLTPEAFQTGAVNTIVKVAVPSSSPTSYKLIGTNTDILGVKNAFLNALRSQHPNTSISTGARYSTTVRGAGVVIGGGATTKSAVHALWMMGLQKIYLVNRDVGEVEAGKSSIFKTYDPAELIECFFSSLCL